MLFLVELDHVKPTAPIAPEAGRAFIEQIILPTLARAEQFMAEKKILSGGAVVGRCAPLHGRGRVACACRSDDFEFACVAHD
jgi:hypothetical protein